MKSHSLVVCAVFSAFLISETATSQEIRRSFRVGEEWEYDVQYLYTCCGLKADYRSRVKLDAIDSSSTPALFRFQFQDTGTIGLSFLPESKAFKVSESAQCRLQDEIFSCDRTRICMPDDSSRCIDRELDLMFGRSVFRSTADSDLASGIGKVVSDSGVSGYIWKKEFYSYPGELAKERFHVESRLGLILANFYHPSKQTSTSRILTLKSHDRILVDAGKLVAAMDKAATPISGIAKPFPKAGAYRPGHGSRSPFVRFFNVLDRRYFDAAGRTFQ